MSHRTEFIDESFELLEPPCARTRVHARQVGLASSREQKRDHLWPMVSQLKNKELRQLNLKI